MHKIKLVNLKKHFNKVAKQQIIVEKKIRLKALLIPPDNEKKEIFCMKTTYLKILNAI